MKQKTKHYILSAMLLVTTIALAKAVVMILERDANLESAIGAILGALFFGPLIGAVLGLLFSIEFRLPQFLKR